MASCRWEGGESGFFAGAHCHRHESTDERGGKKLADDGLGGGERSSKWIEWSNCAADGGEGGKAEVGKLRGELVDVHRRGSEVERTRVELLKELIGRCPRHTDQQIYADAALHATPGYGSFAEHHKQDDTDVKQQREDDGSAAQ